MKNMKRNIYIILAGIYVTIVGRQETCGSDLNFSPVEAQNRKLLASNLNQNGGFSPHISSFPTTSFTCAGRRGYYADVETGCQVFHICEPGRKKFDFFCSPGTLFNQKYAVCDWSYNVDCQKSPDFFSVNDFNSELNFGELQRKHRSSEFGTSKTSREDNPPEQINLKIPIETNGEPQELNGLPLPSHYAIPTPPPAEETTLAAKREAVHESTQRTQTTPLFTRIFTLGQLPKAKLKLINGSILRPIPKAKPNSSRQQLVSPKPTFSLTNKPVLNIKADHLSPDTPFIKITRTHTNPLKSLSTSDSQSQNDYKLRPAVLLKHEFESVNSEQLHQNSIPLRRNFDHDRSSSNVLKIENKLRNAEVIYDVTFPTVYSEHTGTASSYSYKSFDENSIIGALPQRSRSEKSSVSGTSTAKSVEIPQRVIFQMNPPRGSFRGSRDKKFEEETKNTTYNLEYKEDDWLPVKKSAIVPVQMQPLYSSKDWSLKMKPKINGSSSNKTTSSGNRGFSSASFTHPSPPLLHTPSPFLYGDTEIEYTEDLHTNKSDYPNTEIASLIPSSIQVNSEVMRGIINKELGNNSINIDKMKPTTFTRSKKVEELLRKITANKKRKPRIYKVTNSGFVPVKLDFADKSTKLGNSLTVRKTDSLNSRYTLNLGHIDDPYAAQYDAQKSNSSQIYDLSASGSDPEILVIESRSFTDDKNASKTLQKPEKIQSDDKNENKASFRMESDAEAKEQNIRIEKVKRNKFKLRYEQLDRNRTPEAESEEEASLPSNQTEGLKETDKDSKSKLSERIERNVTLNVKLEKETPLPSIQTEELKRNDDYSERELKKRVRNRLDSNGEISRTPISAIVLPDRRTLPKRNNSSTREEFAVRSLRKNLSTRRVPKIIEKDKGRNMTDEPETDGVKETKKDKGRNITDKPETERVKETEKDKVRNMTDEPQTDGVKENKKGKGKNMTDEREVEGEKKTKKDKESIRRIRLTRKRIRDIEI